MGPRSRGGGQGGMPPRQRGRGGGPRGFSNRGEFGERGERAERPAGESGGLGQIDTWNPIGQEQQDQRQSIISYRTKMLSTMQVTGVMISPQPRTGIMTSTQVRCLTPRYSLPVVAQPRQWGSL